MAAPRSPNHHASKPTIEHGAHVKAALPALASTLPFIRLTTNYFADAAIGDGGTCAA